MDNVSRYRVSSFDIFSLAFADGFWQVVLTNGTILEASPKEHTDLYHALKGGLTNLGKKTFAILTIS